MRNQSLDSSGCGCRPVIFQKKTEPNRFCAVVRSDRNAKKPSHTARPISPAVFFHRRLPAVRIRADLCPGRNVLTAFALCRWPVRGGWETSFGRLIRAHGCPDQSISRMRVKSDMWGEKSPGAHDIPSITRSNTNCTSTASCRRIHAIAGQAS